jgi:hypothetical protein
MKKMLIALGIAAIAGLSANGQANTCRGTTKSKSACKSVIVNKEGYCRVHNPNAVRCGAITKQKKTCAMIVTKQGELCRFHRSAVK